MAVRSLFENQRLRTRFPTFGEDFSHGNISDISNFAFSYEKDRITPSQRYEIISTANWVQFYRDNPDYANKVYQTIVKGASPSIPYSTVEQFITKTLTPQNVVINYSTPLSTVSTAMENPSFQPDPTPINPAPVNNAPPSNNPPGMTDADYAALVEKNKATSAALANAYRNAPASDANVNSQANDHIQNDPAPLNPGSNGPTIIPSTVVSTAIPEVKPKSLILPLAATIAAYLLIKG